MVRKKERKRVFLENGSMLLEKLIAYCNGRPIPIRSFSIEELERATNNFDPCCVFYEEWLYKWYKGSFEGRIISVKKYNENLEGLEVVFIDTAISAKMSSHKNVLKLIGCCLETQIPTLVFESAVNGTLADRIYDTSYGKARPQCRPMVWQSRLNIARDIAHAIAYVHTAFSRPIIHSDIKTRNIFLDQHDVAKLSGFPLSVSVPEGETHVEAEVYGTVGFLCPIYLSTGRVTEKADVYSFGMLLLELLTGQQQNDLAQTAADKDENFIDYMRNCTTNEFVDPTILAAQGGACVERQLQAVLQLALTCIVFDQEKRPTLVEVAKELRQIKGLSYDFLFKKIYNL
ncbi:hypothetical protein ACB092_02G170200 [Castanea dentata]